MPFEYSTNLESILNALKDYNTTTASPYLSDSLTTKILNTNIIGEDSEMLEIRADNLPAIFVRISNKEEDFASMGATGSSGVRKKAIVFYDVIAMYSKDSGYDQHATVLDEIYKLARNVEGVFQKERTLSSTALFSQVTETNFLSPIELNNGIMVKSALLKLRAEYLFR